MGYPEELETLKERFDNMQKAYQRQKGRQDVLLDKLQRLESELDGAEKGLEILENVKHLFLQVSENAREQSRKRIETIVTHCLQFIFGPEFGFEIEMGVLRGRAEAEFFVTSILNGEKIRTRPQEARGGGIVDIISLALRIAMLQCLDRENEGPVFLDEPAKHVSEDYIVQVGEFLKEAGLTFERQILMVTHNRHLTEISDLGIRIEMRDGISHAVFDS